MQDLHRVDIVGNMHEKQLTIKFQTNIQIKPRVEVKISRHDLGYNQ